MKLPPLDRAALKDHLTREVFGLDRGAPERPLYGIEAEVLVLDADSLLPLIGPFPNALAHPVLAHIACTHGWETGFSSVGSPVVSTPWNGRFSLEPGGQIEYSSAPQPRADTLLEEMEAAGIALVEAVGATGLEMITRGIDPLNPVEVYPLVVGSDRYRRLAAHLSRLGPAGARMMRQTISIQVNVAWGNRPLEQWGVANRAAPYLLAIFANSPRYCRRASGHRSTRASQWRSLDPTRTGLPFREADPVQAYLDFALNADAFLMGEVGAQATGFGKWVDQGSVSKPDWERHLSSLFPEVRPRGYLEFRGLDSLPVRWWSVPLTIISGLLTREEVRRAVRTHLPSPSADLLVRAGKWGLGDAEILRGADLIWELGVAGCESLREPGWGRALEIAREFETEVLKKKKRSFGDRLSDPGCIPEPGDMVGAVEFGVLDPDTEIKSVR